MDHLFVKTAFQPEELSDLKLLFDDITSQPWFDPSDGAKEAFARYLIETFPSGAFDARKHRSVVEASARMFYSSDTAA
ncbi:hypothetical protein [Shinella zoogloeoides]|uniref:hypothetical protein n=1 Tax=Shinella zoogloeoides TaxID=352475 RepID=UPI000E65BC9E|nr:hypothetical protein [Shinella zoogloeoides]